MTRGLADVVVIGRAVVVLGDATVVVVGGAKVVVVEPTSTATTGHGVDSGAGLETSIYEIKSTNIHLITTSCPLTCIIIH